MKKTRKIACHRILFPQTHSSLALSVVEIQSGIVTQWYPLTQELPQTEWLSGDVLVKTDDDGLLRAYHNGKQL